MRHIAILSTLALLASLGAGSLSAQDPRPHDAHEAGLAPAPEALSPRSRELGRRVEPLREQIQETNRWMLVHGSPDGLHGVGTEMAHTGEHLQELIRRLDEAYTDPEITVDPTSRREVEALGEQVRELERQLGRTLAVLRVAIGYR